MNRQVKLGMGCVLLLALVGTSHLWAAKPKKPDPQAAEKAARLAELDAYWGDVSRAVREGDFDAYKATCHDKGVLVAGVSKRSMPLAKALAGWKKEFEATKAGKVKSNVTFRFSQRLNDATTAHETGVFLYTATPTDKANAGAKPVAEYIHFEGLLLKEAGKWRIMMEYQKARATKEDFDALAAAK